MDWIESESDWMENEVNEEWTEGELREFEGIEQKLINETLCWKKEAVNKIRAVYPENSRTTKWRQKQSNIKLEEHAKGIKKIDTFFQPVSESIGMSNKSSSSSSCPIIQNPPPLPIDTIIDLHVRLEEINKLCSIGKSTKDNRNTFTYDYIRLLSVRMYIQKLLDGQGKMAASNQIAQSMWNKGIYMAQCIRKWGGHFIHTGELPVHSQGKHMKIKSLLNDEDFTEDCKAWLWQ